MNRTRTMLPPPSRRLRLVRPTTDARCSLCNGNDHDPEAHTDVLVALTYAEMDLDDGNAMSARRWIAQARLLELRRRAT